MLEDLNKIDWDSVDAQAVPVWIQQLTTEKWGQAADNLDENVIKINHQDYDTGNGISTILNSDLPILIVPFLIEVLECDDNSANHAVIDMLIAISLYKDMRFEGEEFQARMLLARSETWKGLNTYKRILFEHDHFKRRQIFILLTRFPEYHENVMPLLELALENETNDVTKQTMQKYLEMFRLSLCDNK